MSDTVDTVILPRWVVPVVPEGSVLEEHAVVIGGGEIRAVLPRDEALAQDLGQVLELPEHALIPGLVNMHGHAAMALLRGYADDLPLMPWLQDEIWPAEGRHVGEDFVFDGLRLALAEMLRGGITCFSDMYFFPNVTARLCQQLGVRTQITFPIFDFPTAWGKDADDYISKGLALRDDYKQSELVSVVFGPHATYTVNEQALQRVGVLAAELDLPIHIHLHETADEVDDAVRATGERPLQRLNALGLLGPRTQCVHMTAVNDDDMELLAASGAHVVHCPESNMKLASGTCPVTRLQDAGVNVALGTDGAASNNDLDLFGEMRAAALLAKLASGDASALPAPRALSMATICGARAMGLDDRIGSIEVGKRADLVAVDLSACNTQPVFNPISQLVYACNSRQVSHSWIDGRPVLDNGELCDLDVDDVRRKAAEWARTIAEAAP